MKSMRFTPATAASVVLILKTAQPDEEERETEREAAFT